MIKRIVKLTIKEEKLAELYQVLDQHLLFIRNVDGCNHLEILKSKPPTNIVWTISIWESEEALNNYRNHPKFYPIWKALKATFAEKAEAWTNDIIYHFETADQLIKSVTIS